MPVSVGIVSACKNQALFVIQSDTTVIYIFCLFGKCDVWHNKQSLRLGE